MIIEEILLNETDYSCAFCGEKRVENLTVHHIDGNKNNNKYDNKIMLCYNCHHRLTNKKGITDKEIKEKKKSLIKKTLTQYGINALKLSYRNKFGIVAMPFLLYHLVDMGYMKKEEEIESYSMKEPAEILTYERYNTEVTARFVITPEGRKLYEKWLR